MRRDLLQKKAQEEVELRQQKIKAMNEAQRVEYVTLTTKLGLVRSLKAGVDCSKNNRKNKIRKINNRITDLLEEVELE